MQVEQVTFIRPPAVVTVAKGRQVLLEALQVHLRRRGHKTGVKNVDKLRLTLAR